MKYNTSFMIGDRKISGDSPTYFIADIGANHDGELSRAKELIKLAADAGADCVKFQHFRAKDIVSRRGFAHLKVAHQSSWEKPVYETYEDYSIDREWNPILAETSKDCGVDFMTTPYDIEGAAEVNPYVKAFKIGSGDITYHDMIDWVADLDKPIFLATGASDMNEVEAAVKVALKTNPNLCLLQCNTNYTGSLENFKYVNLRVLQRYALYYPGLPLGLSDHTPGHTAVLGAVSLGARVIEKHFTDDNRRKGPDHQFALVPWEWRHMVWQTRDLENALGDGIKRIEPNEMESVIVQRRALRLRTSHSVRAMIVADGLEALRPCPNGAFTPAQLSEVVGRRINKQMEEGQEIYPYDLEPLEYL